MLLLVNRGVTQYDPKINNLHIFNYDKQTILQAIQVFEYYNRTKPIEKDKELREKQLKQYKRLLFDSIKKGYFRSYQPYNHQEDILQNAMPIKEVYEEIQRYCKKHTIEPGNIDKTAETILNRNKQWKDLFGIPDEK
jgi:hypothetical protein